MLTTDERRTAASPAAPSRPRLRLQPDLWARTLLDGGWWPRSADPAAELPGLILAIEETSQPDHPDHARPSRLLTATARTRRTDLLTVPPHTGEPAARAAMDQAARAGNRTRTPALLAALTTAAIPGRPPAGTLAGTTPDSIQLSTWEWEGGQDGTRSQRAATSAAI